MIPLIASVTDGWTPTTDVGWHLEIGPLLLIVPITVAYLIRWRAVNAHPARLLSFTLGIAAAVVALMSPVDPLGDHLFSMHMAQHLLLLDIAPVLILLGLTKPIFRPATRRVIQLEKTVPWLMAPTFAILAYTVGMWLWHWPWLYNQAVVHSTVHVTEHITFALIGGLYWWHVLSPVRDQRQLSGMGAVLYMVTTKVTVGALGLGLTFLPRELYDVYIATPDYWGLDALTDQRLGGALMALEQMIIMGIALAWLMYQMFDRSEKQLQRQERLEDRAKATEAAAAVASAERTGSDPRPPELY